MSAYLVGGIVLFVTMVAPISILIMIGGASDLLGFMQPIDYFQYISPTIVTVLILLFLKRRNCRVAPMN